MKILLAGLFHETHCFTDDRTALDAFRITRGEALLARAGEGSQIAGFLSVAARECWDVIPGICYEAFPAGLVEHAVFEMFWSELLPILDKSIAAGLDGIFLSLHGAMVTTGEEDTEGELLRRIRAVPGAAELPIFGVFDLHANFSPAMAQLADGLLGYRENPHIDAYECGARAAELLARCLASGVRPIQRLAQPPIVWAPIATGTADRPMRVLESRARRLEADLANVLAINVVAGFAFSDVRDAGLSFSAIVERDTASADTALRELAELAWSLRHEGIQDEQDLDEVLAHILPVEHGPVLLVEPADNIGGGAPGDCTDTLRALVRHGVRNAGVIIADPQAVSRLQDVPIGGRLQLSIGGKGSHLDPGPVLLEVQLISRSDGHFELEDRKSHAAGAFGVKVDMGACAVVRHEGVTILLTSVKTPPWDLGQWRSQGIDPGDLGIIAVKAAVAHRRAYEPIAKASYTVRTRGPCTSDLHALPYRNLRRPIFPLDPFD
ncbi:MAG TPA: M81 family metallopeptidase [Steroidobacteraceae bacterium]|nr:M81 family metallopeptidase [Steroidobacteraceae bacterium]